MRRKKASEPRTEQLGKLMKDVDNSTCYYEGILFETVKILNRMKFENPKIEDNEWKPIIKRERIHRNVADHFHFKERYRHEKIKEMNAFICQGQ